MTWSSVAPVGQLVRRTARTYVWYGKTGFVSAVRYLKAVQVCKVKETSHL
jgi:hypothetical protein